MCLQHTGVQMGDEALRWQGTALMMLQEAAEIFLVQHFNDACLCAIHAKRVTVKPEDSRLVARLRRYHIGPDGLTGKDVGHIEFGWDKHARSKPAVRTNENRYFNLKRFREANGIEAPHKHREREKLEERVDEEANKIMRNMSDIQRETFRGHTKDMSLRERAAYHEMLKRREMKRQKEKAQKKRSSTEGETEAETPPESQPEGENSQVSQ